MPITSRFASAAARAYGMFRTVAGGAAAAVDPFFNYVTALLHGDGTNGAQNNTFLDSSTNNFTITRNGNTTQGTFSPFSQTGWSNYFSSSYITQSSSITFGTNSYTIEFWVNQSSRGSSPNWFDGVFSQTSGAVRQYIDIGGGEHNWVVYDGSTRQVNINLGTLPPLNTWTHYALVRNGNTFTAYINGTQVGTATSTYSIPAMAIQIGWVGTSDGYLNGYISNFRAVNGTAVYTSTFTPPTSPLTAITNTALLTCQSNRFLDNSSNAFTFTVTGSPSVQPFSPFNPTSAWSASSNGGSGYFDGSGDYLTVPDNAALEGFDDFTIEFWVYLNSTSDQTILTKGWDAATTFSPYNINITSGNLVFTASYNGSSWAVLNQVIQSSIGTGRWYHIAVSRSGSAYRLFSNGSLTTTVTSSGTLWSNTAAVTIGATSAATQSLNGYLCDLRIVKGTAVYTAAFTPPTAPLTAITNTSLLLNYTNAGIYDNAAVADYETVGNAQVSTSVKKYGTGSMAFDGTGDYLFTPSNQNLAFGTANFTIEFWIYFNVVNTIQLVLDFRPNATASSASPELYLNSDGTLRWLVSGVDRITSGSLSASNWYHIAICRVASQTKLFVNGTQSGSTYADTTSYLQSGAAFGFNRNAGGSAFYYLNGYIDDLRITNGVGRYQYNFTPPTAAFPNIGGTVTPTSDQYFNYTTLLLPGNGTNGAQNNTFLDSSSNAFTITRNGNTTQGTFTPFSQTGWGAYFDGSGDYLITTSTQVIPTGSFTVEAFVYPTSSSDSYAVAQGTTGNAGRFSLGITSSLWYVQIGTAQVNAGSVALNQWTHLAATFNGTTLTLYVNGTSVGTAATTTNAQNTTLRIGSLGPADWGTFYWTGYISNTRSTNSVVYTSNFTPPTSALTAISGTTFLSCQSNRFIDNSTNAYAITRNGDVSIQAFSPFAPTAAYSASTVGGSGYFDGSGDYLSAPDNAAWYFTGDFTVECWAYWTSTASAEANVLAQHRPADASNQAIEFWSNSTTLYLAYSSSSSTTTITANQWYHLAMSCTSGTASCYVNGTRIGTFTMPTRINSADPFTVGARTGSGGSGGTGYFTGYVTDVRVVNGTGLYSGTTISVPTAPLTAVANTQLLLSYTNGAITDATAKNDLETVGNAQISTTQSKFGGSSMYFDGTGDWLYSPSSNLYSIGSGDFTVEYWLYLTANFTAAGSGMVTAAYDTNWNVLGYNSGSGNIVRFYVVNSFIDASTAITLNTWTHVAITRYNNTARIFINGIQSGSGTLSGTGGNSALYVGTNSHNTAQTMTGYIDDLRITKGIARYTSNFTPPTTAFLTL